MKGKGMISIIVPVYKVEKYLTRCIDSVINQTFTDFELILVDDGSTDGTVDILKSYEEKYKNIIPEDDLDGNRTISYLGNTKNNIKYKSNNRIE